MPKNPGTCTTKGGVTARVRLAVDDFLTKLVPGQYPSPYRHQESAGAGARPLWLLTVK